MFVTRIGRGQPSVTDHRRARWRLLCITGVVGLLGGVVAFAAPSFAQATNDDFDNPIVITGLPFVSTTDATGASTAPDDPWECPNSGSQWYRYTAPSDGMLRIVASNPFAVGVYVGSRGSLEMIGCNKYVEATPVLVEVTAGTAYYIMAGSFYYGYDSSSASITLDARLETGPPANDDFDHPLVITSLSYASPVVDTLLATSAADDPVDCGSPPGLTHSAWFRVNLAQLGSVVLTTTGYRAIISVWTGGRGALQPVTCASEYVSFDAQAGTDYMVMVASQYGTGGDLNLIARPPLAVTALTVNKKGTVNRSDTASVNAMVSCNTTSDVYLQARLTQVFNRPPITIEAWSQLQMPCSDQPTAVTLTFPQGTRFAAGQADVWVRAAVCEPGACHETLVQRPVNLTRVH
jgi:hypothetical protein